ncbi:hypothetical protein [Xanthomarina spongicola]|uniref:Uncharacterized protein n=1 Tax=Xanthomarina spongicola TaxID=570520 RepID=A0A316DT07_9FLAO|nr:hypothetical protein [Xanthomarina spongicola]PWK20906.1 hypothetical protein LX78_00613 [Xanthomarina spongicola]
MNTKLIKRYTVLGILFFLPVLFLLMLFPAKHHYSALDIVNENVADINNFDSEDNQTIILKDHITVLGFLGKNPMDNAIAASNLKELVYDKFKGFKKFQIVLILPHGTEDQVEILKREIKSYEDLKYWHFVYGEETDILKVFNSLKSRIPLKEDLSTQDVFIVDKDLNQRGRIDDRTDSEKEKEKAIYPLYSYDCIEVAEIKNKMSADDLRVLFQEYREKRKGNFDSSTRRANDLKPTNEQ